MGRTGLGRLLVLLAAALVLCAARPAAAADPAEVRAAVERVFSSNRIQGDLPEDGAGAGSDGQDASSRTPSGS